MKTYQPGFTLIELMIVVTIIGVLAAIALPAYNDYVVRSRVTELINVAGNAKASVSEYRVNKGTMPTSNALAGVSSITTNFADSITISAGGVITVVGNQTALGSGGPLSIILTPTYANNAVKWTCTSSGATQYVPSSCK